MSTGGDAHTFPCPACGAEVDFDAKQGTMTCAYCGHTSEVPVTELEIKEYDLEAALKGMVDAPHETGYGEHKHSLRCESCGAVNTMDEHIVSTECAFCGSNQVVPMENVAQVVKPESLLPFRIDQDTAAASFRQWLGRGFFRPNPVKKIASEARARLQGVYLPFWTFDARTQSWWWADAGYYYYRTEEYWDTDDEGHQVRRTREVQEVRWEPASGNLDLPFNDVLVPAALTVEQEMIERIYPFDTGALVPYDPKFLSGWGAEAYTVDLREGWEIGQEIIDGKVRIACALEVPGDTQRNLRVSTTFRDLKYKHVLFPVWLASYRYGDKTYRFLVNGQTGEVQGQAPISWIKVALVVILAAIVISVVLLLITVSESGTALDLYRSILCA
jgi:predicted RNA-binding Zn-ribbon protein involved in translation (DUF1610 family)